MCNSYFSFKTSKLKIFIWSHVSRTGNFISKSVYKIFYILLFILQPLFFSLKCRGRERSPLPGFLGQVCLSAWCLPSKTSSFIWAQLLFLSTRRSLTCLTSNISEELGRLLEVYAYLLTHDQHRRWCENEATYQITKPIS